MEWYEVMAIIIGCVAVWIAVSVVFYRGFFKRFYDVVLSGLALLVLSPLLLVLTVTGAIAMKGNPFFTQERPGRHEKIFKLIKFRTMSNATDKDGNWLPDEIRLNRYGRILRSTSLDELPELFNIIKGDMSIVGPRPLLVRYLPCYTEEERHRHDVRPGLSGLAQVHGRNCCSWSDRFIYDLQYVKRVALLTDLKIIWLSVLVVVKRQDITVGKENIIEDLDVERKMTYEPVQT